MHFLCISFFLFTYYVYVCVWFYFFRDWSKKNSHFPYVYVHLHLPFCFNIIYIRQVIGVLRTIIFITFPFQKLFTNCHVVNVIISPTCGVHYNVCHSKSMNQKLGFFVVPLKPMINMCYWLLKENNLKQLYIWQNLKFWICLVQNKFNSSFQFAFKVNSMQFFFSMEVFFQCKYVFEWKQFFNGIIF
jgi:hypothetical protein